MNGISSALEPSEKRPMMGVPITLYDSLGMLVGQVVKGLNPRINERWAELQLAPMLNAILPLLVIAWNCITWFSRHAGAPRQGRDQAWSASSQARICRLEPGRRLVAVSDLLHRSQCR